MWTTQGGSALGFAALADGAARHAAALQARGVAAGGRVAVLAPNGPPLVVLRGACWWHGAVACPLNTRWSVAELRHALADATAALLVVAPAFDGLAAELSGICPVLAARSLAAEAAGLAGLPDSRTGGDASAALLYTGGTTGRSKGVMLSHANLWTAAISRGAELPTQPTSVSLLVAPLFHVAGLSRLVGRAIMGGLARRRVLSGLWADRNHDGHLFIVDRLKDMIISGGENVYCAEVEAALRSHPAVADAAVIGVPDATWGEAVHAVVVLHGVAVPGGGAVAALQSQLTAWCRQQLAGYKCPRSMRLAAQSPMSAAGKVLKTVLRAGHGR